MKVSLSNKNLMRIRTTRPRDLWLLRWKSNRTTTFLHLHRNVVKTTRWPTSICLARPPRRAMPARKQTQACLRQNCPVLLPCSCATTRRIPRATLWASSSTWMTLTAPLSGFSGRTTHAVVLPPALRNQRALTTSSCCSFVSPRSTWQSRPPWINLEL